MAETITESVSQADLQVSSSAAVLMTGLASRWLEWTTDTRELRQRAGRKAAEAVEKETKVNKGWLW